MLYNELTFNSRTLEFCDDLWWYYTLGYFYLEATFGYKTCYVGTYERFMADTKSDYTCEMTYYTLDNLVDHAFFGQNWGNLLLNTCDKEAPGWVKMDSPSGPQLVG